MTTNNGREALEAPERVFIDSFRMSEGYMLAAGADSPLANGASTEYVRVDQLATAKQAGIDEGLEMAIRQLDVYAKPDPWNGGIRLLGRWEGIQEAIARIRALKSEKANG